MGGGRERVNYTDNEPLKSWRGALPGRALLSMPLPILSRILPSLWLPEGLGLQ